jgi:hypothetical protein
MGRTRAGVATIIAVIAVGCGGKHGPATGSERGPCYPNATCDQGLSCLSNFCVRVDSDAGGDATGLTGLGGSDAGSGPGTGGGAGSGGTGGTGTAGTGTGGTGTGGTFPVAPHAPLPQVGNLGGAVLSAPTIRPIFFANDPDEDDIKSFLVELAAGSYWPATTSEYGVGKPLLQSPVTGTTVSSSTIADSTLQLLLATNMSSTSAPWGAADPSTIYLFVLPPGLSVNADGAICCRDFGGYHNEANVNGVEVPYAVACTCPDFFGPGWSQLDERTVAMSHELVEAATDPFPRSDPAFYGANQANLAWTLVTGGELADMCVVQPDIFTVPTGGKYVVQKSWSNEAARLGRDPCVPAAATPPYFNSMPALDVIPYGTTGYETRGLQIPLGSSRTIDLDLFSAGAVTNGWNVAAYAYEDFVGGTPSLAFSLNKTSGRNGDVLRLTITALRSNPTLGVSPFIVLSTVGAPGGIDYRSHVAMGLVTN